MSEVKQESKLSSNPTSKSPEPLPESSRELSRDSITFGKYNGKTLQNVLKDRSYCEWLLKQEWFQKNYAYLHNRVQEYEPLPYFCNTPPSEGDFLQRYLFFNLKPVEEVGLPLTPDEKKCYEYYLRMAGELKQKITDRLETDNPYAIKAPCRWLKRFEREYELKRDVFKTFLSAYELPNIPYLVERIKKEGGIEYKGARSFNIAKKRSKEQETYWEKLLKGRYGEDLGTQFQFEKCIFDFINISTNTIFECKLGLKDFDLKQYQKYRKVLGKYRIIYLIGYDCVISMERGTIYTSNVNKYMVYQFKIPMMKKPSKFDELIKEFEIVYREDLSLLFGTSE